MPVDYTGAVLAVLLWAGGVWWTLRWASAAVRARPERAFRYVFWAIWAIVGVCVAAVLTVWLYDHLRFGA